MTHKEYREKRAKQFIRFLKDLGVFGLYKYNFTISSWNKSKLITFLHKKNPQQYVFTAFDWYCAKGGRSVWLQAYHSWERVISKGIDDVASYQKIIDIDKREIQSKLVQWINCKPTSTYWNIL